jgi:hypothetical protein
MDALAAGVLGGVAAPEVACFWFEGEGRRTALVWPFGFSARFDPLRLLGGDGQVLATIGDEVELGGGVLPIDRQPRPPDDPCGTGAIFIVSEVATVDGVPLHVRGGSLALDVRSTPDTACQNASEVELLLVMDDGRLRVRDGISGPSRPATWPPGSTAHWGLRIVVLDADGDDLMLQGVEQVLRARVGDQLIDVCG